MACFFPLTFMIKTDKEACMLLMNDIHASKDNISEFKKNWEEALSICEKYGIITMCIGGDLWQSRSSQPLNVLLAVREMVKKTTLFSNPINLVIANGNHCKVDQEDIMGYSHIFADYNGVDVVDDFIFFQLDDKIFYIMAYFPENGSFVSRLEELKEHWKTEYPKHAAILYIHQGINGALATPNEKDLPANIFAEFESVLVGHYHDRCKIKGTNIEYIGSSRQHNFGEDEEKGYTIVYFDGSTQFIKNEVNKRYKTITASLKEIKSEKFAENIRKIKEDERYLIKVKIQCDTKDTGKINKDELLALGVAKIDVVTEETVLTKSNAALEVKFDKTEIKKEYRSFCEQKNILDAEIGLSYLEKIK